MAWLYAIPGWAGLFIVIAVAVGLACSGHAIVRRTFGAELHEHNDVAGFVLAVVGVLYAVLLAFLTVVVWERFAEAENRAHSEVDAAVDVWRLSKELPVTAGSRLQRDLYHYAGVIVGDEWPRLHAGESSARAQAAVITVLHDVAGLRPTDFQGAVLQDHLLERVQVMADLRRRRINDNQSGIRPVVWVALLLGALIVIGFVYLFAVKSFAVQLAMTAGMAAMIALAFALIIELDFPFRGDVSISPERWITFEHTMVAERPSLTGATERRSDRSAGR